MPVLGHFRRRVDAHRYVEELLVEERHAPLDTPCRERLVGAQAVVEVQLTDLAHGFLVEGTGVGRLVEIEVAAENLVGTLAREHHLDAHRLDDARQQVHRRRGAYGRHVVGLDIIDHVAHGIQPFLYGVVDFVVYGADMVGDLACRRQVGRPFQPDGERVELRPPGPVAVVRFDAPVGVFLGDGRDDRRVEAARQQYAVGYVRHELPLDGRFQRLAQRLYVGAVVLHGVVLEPVALVPAHHFPLAARPVVPGQERPDGAAYPFEGFLFRCDVELLVAVPADVERDDADRVAGDQVFVLFDVVQREGEDAADFFQQPDAQLAVERQDHLAVRACLEIVFAGQLGADLLMVVYLAVHGQHLFPVAAEQGLTARLGVDDRKPLVRKDRPLAAVDTRPVVAPVPYLLRHFQYLPTQRIRFPADVK